MVDVVPVLVLLVGLVAVVRPGWVAAVDRRQKAAGTTRRPADVELNETYYAVVRTAGVGLALLGLVLVVRSL